MGDFENFSVKNEHFSIYLLKKSPFSGDHFDGKVMVIRWPDVIDLFLGFAADIVFIG